MIKQKRERDPIHVSASMVERAYKKVQEVKRLIENGKTSQHIFEDMLKLITIEE